MPKRERPEISRILWFAAGWVLLVVLGVLALNRYGPRGPLGYTPAPFRFIACGSLAAVVGAQVVVALASAFVVVRLAESLFGRPMSPRARVSVIVIVGTVFFGLSFGGGLLFRHRFIGVCA